MARFPALFLTILISPAAALATGITGTLVATPGFGTPERPAHEEDRAYYWEVPNGIVPTAPYAIRKDEQIIVTLQGPGLEGEPAGNVDVQIGGTSMIPQTVVAAPGSNVRFINHSGLTVQLFSPQIAGFAPEDLHTAHMRIVTVPQAGTFEVRCGQHPGFRGWLVVAPGVLKTRVAADGTFAFPDIPPGTYDMRVLFRGQPVLARSVRVAADDVELGEIRLGTPEPAPAPVAAQAPAAQEEETGRRGRHRRRGGGGGAVAAPAAAAPSEPRLAPGELRQHHMTGP